MVKKMDCLENQEQIAGEGKSRTGGKKFGVRKVGRKSEKKLRKYPTLSVLTGSEHQLPPI